MDLYTLIFVPIVSGFCAWIATSVANGGLAVTKQRKALSAARDEALQCLLRVKLIEYHDRYMRESSIPSYALENYEMMFKAYHALGGNGMITRMHEEVLDLPVNQ